MLVKNNVGMKIAGVAFCCLTVAAIPAQAAKKKTSVDFKELQLESPYNITHPVMAANIHPQQGTELVTFTADESNNRYLIVYGFNSEAQSYDVIDKILVDKSFISFDIAEESDDAQAGGKLQGLYFMSSSQLVKYQGGATSAFDKLTTVMPVNSLFLKDDPQFISRGNFIKNVNDDQIEDFIIHDFSGAHVFVGQEEGVPKKTTLPIKPHVRVFDDGANYTQTELFIADVNFDKKFDIIRVGEGEVFAHLQNEEGSFEQTAVVMSLGTNVSGIDWWEKRDANGESLDQSNLRYRKVEDLRDVNNDGVTDMVVRYTQSSGVLDKTNDYEVYLGENKQGRLVFFFTT